MLKGREGAFQRAVNHVCHEYCLRRGTQEQKIIFAGQIFSCVLKSIARFGKMLRAKLRLTFVQILWLFGILTLVNCNGKLKLVYIQDDVTDVFYVFKYSIVRCEKFSQIQFPVHLKFYIRKETFTRPNLSSFRLFQL